MKRIVLPRLPRLEKNQSANSSDYFTNVQITLSPHCAASSPSTIQYFIVRVWEENKAVNILYTGHHTFPPRSHLMRGQNTTPNRQMVYKICKTQTVFSNGSLPHLICFL